jgi:hypothetical protein
VVISSWTDLEGLKTIFLPINLGGISLLALFSSDSKEPSIRVLANVVADTAQIYLP